MYIDEHGTDQMTSLDCDDRRYLSLTGVVIEIKHVNDYILPAFQHLKREILGADPDSPVCLHRTDIRYSRGPFEALKSESVRQQFDDYILVIMKKAKYTVITVVLDKSVLEAKHYWERTHPYHVLLEVLIEKYAQLLKRKMAVGDIMPEARGKKQDKALQEEFTLYRNKGTRFVTAGMIKSRIPSKKLKFRTKKDCSPGLELCDLIAHPSHYFIRGSRGHNIKRNGFQGKVMELLEAYKYDRSKSGNIWGYGAKFIP